jgi:hypothetical protein
MSTNKNLLGLAGDEISAGTDDRELSNNEKLGLALIALASPVIGGALEGRTGAYAGAAAGAKGVGAVLKGQADAEEKARLAAQAATLKKTERAERLEDSKELATHAAGLKPEAALKTRAVKTVKDGKEVTEIVEDKPGTAFEAPPKTRPSGPAAGGAGASAPGGKAAADVAKSFETDYAKKTQITAVIDRELEQFKKFMDAGKVDEAARHGEGMLKALNSAFGADAVGVEEADRLGGYLKPLKAPWEPGSMVGRDLDLFYEQVKAKSDALKAAAGDSLQRAETTRSGGIQALSSPTKPGEAEVSDEVAVTAPRRLVGQQYSPSRNKTKLIYSDGKEEIVDGER